MLVELSQNDVLYKKFGSCGGFCLFKGDTAKAHKTSEGVKNQSIFSCSSIGISSKTSVQESL